MIDINRRTFDRYFGVHILRHDQAYIAESGRGWLDALEIARAAFDEADEFFKKNATPS